MVKKVVPNPVGGGGGGGKGATIAVVAVAVVATVATGGLAAAGAATAIGASLTGAAATTTIIGSATVGSVVGGAVIGAGVGAVTGAVQASLVGDNILEGALTGGAVGAASGGAGMLGAGAGAELASEGLQLSTAAGSVDADLTRAVVEASKGATAFGTGAAIQDQNIGEWAAVGAITGAAVPLVTAGLNYSGVPAGDTRNIVAGTVGGALAGGGSAAVTGGDVEAGAMTGAASGLVGSIARPYVTDLANTLFGTGAAAPTGAQALNAQERGQLAGVLSGTASGQTVSNEQFVENAYQALFGRPPEAAGMAYWTGEMAAGASPEQTLNNMIAGATAGDAAAAARFNAAQYLTTPLSAEIGGGEEGGQDVEVVGDYETTPKTGGGGAFTQEIVPDEGAVASEFERGGSESANLLRDLFTFGAEQGVGGSKTVVPFGAGGVTETDRAILETTGLLPFGGDKTATGDNVLATFGGDKTGVTSTGTIGTGTGVTGTGTGTGIGVTGTGTGTGTGMAGTGFGNTTLIGATSGPGTTLTSFGQGGGSGGGGGGGGGGAEAGGGTSTSTSTTGGTTGGGETTGRRDVTQPPGTRREEQVRISPIVTDPRIAPTVQRQAAAQPVLSAGLDPATSGVILSRFGNKNQVWNEATLRLADALGLL
jgi:hypothetical protein